MKTLQNNLSNKIEEANEEIIHLKRILTFEKKHDYENFNMLSRYSPAIIFAIWEGVFKDFIKYYFSFFNRNNVFKDDLAMLTNIIEHNQIIKEHYTQFEAKKRLLIEIKKVFDNPKFNEERPHINPTKFKETNKFLEKINLNPFDYQKYNTKYSELAYFRNNIAHWENLVEISMSDIEEYIELVYTLIDDLENNILTQAEKWNA